MNWKNGKFVVFVLYLGNNFLQYVNMSMKQIVEIGSVWCSKLFFFTVDNYIDLPLNV